MFSWGEFAAQLEGSVKGALNTTQAALPGLRGQGYGRIVNIGTNLFPDAVFDLIAASTPLRRVTTPEEFADAVLFFASPWARSVTGQNLVVNGGLVKN